ncbi:hypothetical protein GALL_154880 [mine drainage metagenome]|uniref:Uncharacterized protein n=1 Tax=mine drainage metagenome TaxID=410659 RepID=A0A1J5S2U6_9ZZZZ
MGNLTPVIIPSTGSGPQRCATGQDLLAIAALGTAARQPVTQQDMRDAIEEIAGHLWVPAFDSLQAVVERLLRRGQLVASGGQAAHYLTTSSGLERLCRLLALDYSHPGCLISQVGMRLGMAFLDLIPAPRRRGYLQSSLHHCDRQLREWQRRSALCRAQGALGRRWLDQDGRRLGQERHMLQAMLADLA